MSEKESARNDGKTIKWQSASLPIKSLEMPLTITNGPTKKSGDRHDSTHTQLEYKTEYGSLFVRLIMCARFILLTVVSTG